MSGARVLQHYGRVLLLVDGRLVADMPHEAALALGKALRGVAKKAEEWDNAERIAIDQAILTRAGMPFGLTSHPVIMGEAIKEAVHNRELRRYMRGRQARGIESREVFGTPKIIQTPPRGLAT